MKVLLLLAFVESALACEVRPIRYIHNSKAVLKSISVCIKNNKASSEDCQDMTSAGCFASGWMKEKVAFNTLVKSVGSPGFNLCHLRGGLPQLYEIEVSPKKWVNFERCQSADLKQFVDIDDLISKVTY